MPEVLVDAPRFRPAVIYRNGVDHHWPVELAEEAIASTLARAVPQDHDPRASLSSDNPIVADLLATFATLDPDTTVTRWEVEDHHMEWTVPAAVAHGARHRIEPDVPVLDIIPFGMNRQPTGQRVGVHVDATLGRSDDYKIDQIAVMAQPAARGGVLTFHPPGGPDVPAPLEVGDFVMFDATMRHSVTTVEAGVRYVISSSTCRQVADWWRRPPRPKVDA